MAMSCVFNGSIFARAAMFRVSQKRGIVWTRSWCIHYRVTHRAAPRRSALHLLGLISHLPIIGHFGWTRAAPPRRPATPTWGSRRYPTDLSVHVEVAISTPGATPPHVSPESLSECLQIKAIFKPPKTEWGSRDVRSASWTSSRSAPPMKPLNRIPIHLLKIKLFVARLHLGYHNRVLLAFEPVHKNDVSTWFEL